MTMKDFMTISAMTVAATALAQRPESPAIETSGGEPMRLERYEVHAEIRGLFASVATTMVFRNPNDRILEGELVFPLPDRAAVCGFALDIGGAMVDAVVVPKDEARVVFETETRRQIDPALVEHVKGNIYKTRIYPLPAKGTRTIKLTYNAPISTVGNAAVLPLNVPPEKIPLLGVTVEVATPSSESPTISGIGSSAFVQVENVWRVAFEEEDAEHPDVVCVTLPSLPAAYTLTEDAGENGKWRQIAQLTKKDSASDAFKPEPLDIYWDVSRSASADAKAAIAALEALATLGTKFRLHKFAYGAAECIDFDNAAALLEAVRAIADYDGATSFGDLFDKAEPSRRKLLFSDGLETASTFAGNRVNNLVAVAVSRTADMAFLRRISGGRAIAASGIAPEALALAVKEAFLRDVKDGDGDAMSLDVGTYRVTLERMAEEVAATSESPSAPLPKGRVTATAWAQLKMEEYSADPASNEDAMLGLGRRYGLVGPKTSMLVLDSLDQWLRYEIEPPATLPEMRERWQEAMKRRVGKESDESRRQRHLANLKQLWKERLAWWKRDFDKDPLPVPKADDEEPGFLRRIASAAGEMLSVNAAAPARESARRSVAFHDEASFAEGGAVSHAAVAMEAPADEMMAPPMATERAAKVAGAGGSGGGRPAAAITVQPWNPDTPYLKELRKAAKDERYTTYLALAADHGASPSFFLDCAGFFFKSGDAAIGERVLSNLAEIKLESADTLRVMAWRLRQAGALDAAIEQFRRIAGLRPEDGLSWRDLAMTLAQRAKMRLAAGNAAGARNDANEALLLYLKTAFTPWQRHSDTVCIFAIEEFNAFVAWIKAAKDWKDGAPEIPEIDPDFMEPIDTDIRIILEWDADNTDLDLHVVEPSGEEAYYAHNRTRRGGMVSRDVTDGFGPEEYMIRKAPRGEYEIFVKYFASHQQTLFGPATATATIYTDWGRAGEKSQTLSLRLEKAKEKVKIGAITY